MAEKTMKNVLRETADRFIKKLEQLPKICCQVPNPNICKDCPHFAMKREMIVNR